MRQKKNIRAGFTLVELSIVLVIVGIIVGGVLTGQQVIQNARVSNAVSGLQAYQAQFQTYTQNYGALPGDDASAGTRFASAGVESCAVTDPVCGDGAIGTNASYNANATAGAAAESRLAWAHMRAANLVKNQSVGGDTSVQPVNPFGGIYGFQNGSTTGAFTTTVVCMDKIPATAAQAIDARLDDGVKNAGSLQSIQGGSDTDAQYIEGNVYTLCTRI